jgi:hypothetical protein
LHGSKVQGLEANLKENIYSTTQIKIIRCVTKSSYIAVKLLRRKILLIIDSNEKNLKQKVD